MRVRKSTYAREKRTALPALTSTKLKDAQRHYVHISYTEFHPESDNEHGNGRTKIIHAVR